MNHGLLFGNVFKGASLLCTAAWASDTPVETPEPLIVEMFDGSRMVGSSVKMDALPVRFDFGDCEVPLAIIDQISLSQKGPEAVLDFRNGDRMTGTLLPRQIMIMTRYGVATVPMADIKKLACLWENATIVPLVFEVLQGNVTILPPEAESKVSTGSNGAAVSMTMINQSRRPVRFIWISSSGGRSTDEEQQIRVQPGETRLWRKTYENHAWVITDEEGKALGVLTAGKENLKILVRYGSVQALDESKQEP